MSEEVTDAGLYVSWSMMWTFTVNDGTGLVFLVSIVFAIPSVDDAMNNPTGYPFFYTFQAAMPDRNVGTNILTVIALWSLTVGNVSFTASCARQAWSFAWDRGLPFSGWITKMNPRVHVPVNATLLTLVCTVLLSMIDLGSNAAFNAILSLQLSSLMASYAICITCIVHCDSKNPRCGIDTEGEMVPGQTRVANQHCCDVLFGVGLLLDILAERNVSESSPGAEYSADCSYD